MAQYQMSYGFKPDGTKDENPVKYDDDDDDDFIEPVVEEKQKKKEEPKRPAGEYVK